MFRLMNKEINHNFTLKFTGLAMTIVVDLDLKQQKQTLIVLLNWPYACLTN